PIGAPGWPELAFWTPSIERVRIVSIARRSRVCVAVVIVGSLPLVRVRGSGSGWRSAGVVAIVGARRTAAILRAMPRRLPVRRRARRSSTPRVTVLGDLMLDVVLAPVRALEVGTDVPGRVSLRQGGSAATTSRWLGRLGVRTTLVCAVGRDSEGRALVSAI